LHTFAALKFSCLKKISAFFLLTILLFQKTNGQVVPDSSTGTFAFSANYSYGFIIAHRQTIVPLQKDHVKGLEISISKPTTGKKTWQRAYNFPSVGLKYFYFDLGNPEQLGFAQALVPYFDFRFGKNKNLQFNFQYGWGVGYIEKKFDVKTNYKNIAIGSHWNSTISFSMDAKVKVLRQTFLNTGISLTHFSNGSAVVPNLGINIAAVKAGVIQYFGTGKPLNRDSLPAFHPGYRNSLYIAGGFKQTYPVEGPGYYVMIFSASRLRQFTRKSAIGLALDVHYDKSIIARLENDSVNTDGFIDGTRAGVSATYELIFTDLSMLVQMGGYFYNSYKSDGNMYHRLGWRYCFYKNYFACFNLKSHWAKADFFEWGVGVKL